MAKNDGKDAAFRKNMINHASEFRSICEVLREIYWKIEDPDTRLKVVEASMMAKKMARKLLRNKFDLNEFMEYESMSDENKKLITKERLDKYKEELDKGIDHPMKSPKDEEE